MALEPQVGLHSRLFKVNFALTNQKESNRGPRGYTAKCFTSLPGQEAKSGFLIEGLCSSNPWEFDFSGFRRN